jgi:hypothetical protein
MTERAREISPKTDIVVGHTTKKGVDKSILLWYNIYTEKERRIRKCGLTIWNGQSNK